MYKPPFTDLNVIELASVLAGPSVGMFFAELGAHVLKIENKRTGGDVTRNWKLESEDPDAPLSSYYNAINWGKQSIFLDLSSPEDRKILDGLLADADILIANFKRGSAEKLSLDYAAISDNHPSIIYANLTAFGESSDQAGYDVLLQAETGYLFMNGHRGGPHAKMPVALIDILAAHQLKEGILIALNNRLKTGKGSYVTVSLAHSAIAALANQASNYLNQGFIPQKMGSQHPNISPYGDIMTTSDGREIILAIGSEDQFSSFCQIIGLPALSSDERFASNADRVAHRDELIPVLQDAVKRFEYAFLMDELERNKIPAGSIRDMEGVFQTPAGKDMILENENGSRCVRTVAFSIEQKEDQ